MLIHYFEAETQGFQGLVDQNFRKKHFLRGFRRSLQITPKGRNIPMHFINESIFVFDLAGGKPE